MSKFKYGIQISVDEVSERTPSILRGTFEECAQKAKSIGYDGVELFMHTPYKKDPHLFKSIAAQYELDITCICTGMEYLLYNLNLTSDDKAVRTAAVSKLKEHIDFAEIIGSLVCIGTMRGQIPGSEYLQLHYRRLEEGLIELSEYAQSKNVKLVVEDNPQYVSNFLNSADEVGNFVRALNLENVGLHLDTHCMAMEDDNIEKSLEKFSDILTYLHYSDANRGYPGSCSIDFLAIAKTLMDIDYQGYITLECQPYPNSEECARRGLQYVKAIEQAATIKRMPLKDTLYKKHKK